MIGHFFLIFKHLTLIITVNSIIITLQAWRDYRFSWLPEEYCGIDTLPFPKNVFWTPDIGILERYKKYSSQNFFSLNERTEIIINDSISEVVFTLKLNCSNLSFASDKIWSMYKILHSILIPSIKLAQCPHRVSTLRKC